VIRKTLTKNTSLNQYAIIGYSLHFDHLVEVMFFLSTILSNKDQLKYKKNIEIDSASKGEDNVFALFAFSPAERNIRRGLILRVI